MFKQKLSVSTVMHRNSLTYKFSKKPEHFFTSRLGNVSDIVYKIDRKLPKTLSIDLQSTPTKIKLLHIKNLIYFQSYSLATFKFKKQNPLFETIHYLIHPLCI